MRWLMVVALAASVLVMPASSGGQEQATLSQKDVRTINELTATLAKGVLAKNWKAVSALYIDTAVLYPAGEAAVKGRDAIETCLAGLPSMSDFTLRNTKIEGREDMVYVQGTYTMAVAAPGTGQPVQESGYYLEIRRRQSNGQWLIAVQMLSPHQ